MSAFSRWCGNHQLLVACLRDFYTHDGSPPRAIRGDCAAMPTDSAAMARRTRKNAQANIAVLDIRLIGIASMWFALYIMMLIGAVVEQTFPRVIEFSAL